MKEQLTSKPFGFPNFCVLDVDGNELHFTSAPGGFTKQTVDLETNNYPFDESKVRETAERSYQALQEYQIFDSLMPAAFHALTEFAAMSFQSDRSMITLIDRKRQGIGALSVVDKEPKHFTRAKLQKLNSLATIANCMIEKMRLYAKIEKCCSVALDK